MNNQLQTIFIVFFVVIAFVSNILGQYRDHGKLNTWTDQLVSREKGNQDIPLNGIRVTKGKGFDRVTIEFGKQIPNWQVEFVKAPIRYSETNDFIKIDGKTFVEISFAHAHLPKSREREFPLNFPKETLKLSLINEIKNSDAFEGYFSFAIGLKERVVFRVQQLSNPARLVIDFMDRKIKC